MTSPAPAPTSVHDLEITEEELRAFVGPSADEFLMRWDGSRTPVFPAFFFSTLWCVSRRMYLLAILVAATQVEIARVLREEQARALKLVDDSSWSALGVETFFVLLGLAFPVIFSLTAGSFYYGHAVRRIRDVKRLTSDPAERLERIRAAGGTRITWAVLIFLMGVGTVVSILASL